MSPKALVVVLAVIGANTGLARADPPPPDSTVVVCGPYTFDSRAETTYAIAPWPGPQGGLYWYWGIKPPTCQLVPKHRSPSLHAYWIYLSSMHWPVWNSQRAVGEGEFFLRGFSPITVTLTRPRKACGHSTFTLAMLSFPNGHSTMPLNDWCV